MRALLPALLSALAFLGCGTDRGARSVALPRAECLVCKSEGDLACVGVRVDASTPRFEWHGVVYYFCGDDCRRRFERHPEEFVPGER